MYFKGFASIYDGTLTSNGPWEALVTFQQFLFLADREGVVDMNAAAISRRTTVPLAVIERGISALEADDPLSRRPNDGGRRLRRLDDHRDWGWQIVNFAHYQDLLSAEQKREYNRNYQQERRSKFKIAAKHKGVQDVQSVNVDKVDIGTQLSELSMSRQEEVETKEEVKKTPSAPNEKISFDAAAVDFNNITAVHRKSWAKAYPAIDIDNELAKAAVWLHANPKNVKSNYARFLGTWFGKAQQRAPALGGGPKGGKDTYL